MPNKTPKNKPQTKRRTAKKDKVEVAGQKVSRRQAKFAKAFAVTGDPLEAIAKSGSFTRWPAQETYKMLKNPAVIHIINAVREQTRGITPLSMEEVKQLIAEMALVSPLDLMEENGEIDAAAIKQRGLARFVKEIKQEITFDKDGNKTIKNEIKGYSRLDALKLQATIHQEEENKDLQIIQAICHLIATYQNLNTPKERERIFNAFAEKNRVPIERIRENFGKFSQYYLPAAAETSDNPKSE